MKKILFLLLAVICCGLHAQQPFSSGMNKEDIAKLEVRIAKTTVDLYDKINKEIDNCYENIDFEEEELEHYQFLYNKFSFLEGIIGDESNSKNYELIYTKY